jgi:hypothetical protein
MEWFSQYWHTNNFSDRSPWGSMTGYVYIESFFMQKLLWRDVWL